MFDALYAGFAGLIANISNFMYSYLLIILLLAAGIYFTCRSKFVQLRLLGESIRVVSEKSDDKHAVSAFEALMVSTASRVGTGNIVGVANAIAIGGYGSAPWWAGPPPLWRAPWPRSIKSGTSRAAAMAAPPIISRPL